jgi:hypothetical protein
VFATAAVVHTAIWAGPIFVFSLQSSSMRLTCARVRPGMTLSEVQGLFHGVKPVNEAIVGAELRFETKDLCVMELEPTTHKVLSAQFREETIGGVE